MGSFSRFIGKLQFAQKILQHSALTLLLATATEANATGKNDDGFCCFNTQQDYTRVRTGKGDQVKTPTPHLEPRRRRLDCVSQVQRYRGSRMFSEGSSGTE